MSAFKISIIGIPNAEDVNIPGIVFEEAQKWKNNVVNAAKLDLSGKKLDVRTGNLRNKIDGTVKQSGNKTTIKVGTKKVPYAKIQDDKSQTNIMPKDKKFLTVPVNRTIKGRARQYKDTFVIKSKQGNLLLVQKKGKGKKAKLKPLFVLRKNVAIQGTGYLTDNVTRFKPFLELAIRIRFINFEI